MHDESRLAFLLFDSLFEGSQQILQGSYGQHLIGLPFVVKDEVDLCFSLYGIGLVGHICVELLVVCSCESSVIECKRIPRLPDH